MSAKKSSSIRRAIWIVATVLSALLYGCDSLLLSERQKVVQESHDAMCKARDLQAMRPFVTSSSIPLLDISKPIVAFAGLFGMNVADRIAIECKSNKLKFIDEVQVSESRYIIRTKYPESIELNETVLVLEEGKWKISLLGL